MNIENAKKQIKRGVLEYCILAILSKEKAYPAEILTKMQEAELLVLEGTIYPLLTRLKGSEILAYSWVESNQGPPRKYYEITELGAGYRDELAKTWESLVLAVTTITKEN